MRYIKKLHSSGINVTTDTIEESKTLEQKIAKLLHEGEPLDTSAPIIYTARKDGVLPEYDIRTDRFEYAQNAMDKSAKSIIAHRQNLFKIDKDKDKDNNKDNNNLSA